MSLARRLREPAPLARAEALDGLRALLAWWVVLYHARGPNFSAALEHRGGPLTFLSQGSLAVDVFMVLSGFVIFFLLDRERETPGVFFLRRWLRLFPVYAVCLVAMLPFQALSLENLRANAPHVAPAQLAAMLRDVEEPWRELGAQLAVHAAMLHGAIPDAWLHGAPGAFLNPAWSISLEWQFYLLAPAVFWLWRRGGAIGAVAWLLVTALAFATRRSWPAIQHDAFLPLQLHLFTLGMASYVLFKAASIGALPQRWLARAPALATAAVGAFLAVRIARFGWSRGTAAGDWLPLAIWLLVLGVLLAGASGTPGAGARTAERVLEWRPLARLGAVSYATYLVHWPVLTVCQALFRGTFGDPAPALVFALHLAISLPLVALASFALHRMVERPGIALGRRLAARV